MNKWNLIVDVAECTNCNNCFIACKDEYVGNDIEGYSRSQPLHGHKWINILKNERGSYPHVDITYLPTMCNHCDNAPCIEKGQGAVYQREDGIVIIDPVKAKGRKDLVEACPYGAIWWNEEHSLPQAWQSDAHLLDRGWDKPRCVQSCPTGALKALKVSDESMATIIRQQGLEPLRADLDSKPRVLYKNLSRFNSHFVAGEVLVKHADVIDCLADTTVELYIGEEKFATTRTDAFGEYQFDGLADKTGKCDLTFSHDKYGQKKAGVVIKSNSLVVDSVVFEIEQK